MKTNREQFLAKHNVDPKESYSLKRLSDMSKVPFSILQQVYNRGIGAHSTQSTSVRLKGSFVKNVKAPMSMKLSPEQWGFARVFSFLNGSKKHDNDLRANKEKVGGISKAVGFVRKAMAVTREENDGYNPPTRAGYDYDTAVALDKPSPFIQTHFGDVEPKKVKKYQYKPRVKSAEEQEREEVFKFSYWGLEKDDFEVIDGDLVEKKHGLIWPPIKFQLEDGYCWGLRCCRFKRDKKGAKEMIPTNRHYEWIYFRDEDKCGSLPIPKGHKFYGNIYKKPLGKAIRYSQQGAEEYNKYETVKPPGANPPTTIDELVRQPARAKLRQKNNAKKSQDD